MTKATIKTFTMILLLLFVGTAYAEELKPITALIPVDIVWANNRADYEAKTGVQAPRFDDTKPPKYWADFDAAVLPPTGLYSFNTYINGVKTEQKVTNADAAVVNIPGVFRYPPDVIKDTPIYTEHPVMGKSPLSPTHILLPEEAEQMKREMTRDGVEVRDMRMLENIAGGRLVYNGDPRRYYTIVYVDGNDKTFVSVAGMLLHMYRYRSGVGAPGKWGFDNYGNLRFFAEAQVEKASLSAVPWTLRDLAEGESVVEKPFSGWVLQIGESTGAGGGDAAASSAVLEELKSLRKSLDLMYDLMLDLYSSGGVR